MTSYGSLPADDASTPLLEEQRVPAEERQDDRAEWRVQLGEILENEKLHLTIVGLTILDATCVLAQIFYTFFHECQIGTSPNHWVKIFIELADIISQVVTCTFLLELSLALVAFGPKYFLPGWPHWKFHVLDLVGTFCFKVI